jgi:DNA-binding CsgD family transcriptional regulator/PAS domain-containing protein
VQTRQAGHDFLGQSFGVPLLKQSRKNLELSPTSQTTNGLLASSRLFDEINACFDDLLNCALQNTSWSHPVQQICTILGSERCTIDVTGGVVVPRVFDDVGIKTLTPRPPVILQAGFEGVSITLTLWFPLNFNADSGSYPIAISTIERHLYRCLVVMVWRWKLPRKEADIKALIAAMKRPCVLLDDAYKIAFFNNAARAVFGLKPDEGWIDSTAWRSAIDQARSDFAGQSVCTIRNQGLLLKLLTLTGSRANTIVEITLAQPTLLTALDTVARKFSLSNCETAVLGCALNGDDVDQIANRRGVSRETIRAQMRACRTKTGTQSQFQLIGLVNQVFARLRASSTIGTSIAQPEVSPNFMMIEGGP